MIFVTSPFSLKVQRRSRTLRSVLFVLLIAKYACSTAADIEFFEKEVRPLLVKRCYACHSGTKTSGGLALDSKNGWERGSDSGPIIVPGEPENSLLIAAVNYDSLQMPPPDMGGKLSDDEITVLTKWVQRGAIDPRELSPTIAGMTAEMAKSWWAFQSLTSGNAGSTEQSIDNFVDRQLQTHRLGKTPLADKRTLIRRATYDLTGLPPTENDVADFLADDTADAFATVINRLLNSDQYGARWARHWLDVVRYADTAGENTDRPLPHAWRYRNWVINSFNRNMPFDEFVRLQICGDISAAKSVPKQRIEGIIATGYLAIARRFGHDIDKDIHLMHEDVIDNVGKTFMGLTFGCARCHDHKYDPITAEDYYALYGIFDSTKFAFPGCEPKGQPRDLVPLVGEAENEAKQSEYENRLAAWEKRSSETSRERIRLRDLGAKAIRVLIRGAVAEGQEVSLNTKNDEGQLKSISMQRGEVLQLAVMPNANHGADTTRVELEITRLADNMRWNVADLIPHFINSGPMIRQNGAAWCFMDVSDGPSFLRQKKASIDGASNLHAWANGDTPSVFVNAADTPASVWTTLPENSFFMHPGPKHDVALAWICPADGNYQVHGRVADGHPAELDGVSFRFEHFTSTEFGDRLAALGDAASAPKVPKPEPPDIPVAYAVVEGNPRNVKLHERGDTEQPGEEIPRRWLSVFGSTPVPPESGSGRRELAEWIVEHPLFARVIVNRIWQWHFGHGIVRTPNDFGSRGEPPTHPKLLDWLAAHFRDHEYDVKSLHRLIMTSNAYQRESLADESFVKEDPENRWVSRFSRRRLSAEEIRDTLLTVSNQIDLSIGEQHPFPAEKTWTFTQHSPFNAAYETDRRSVFLMVQRQRRHPYLALFDGADPNSSTAIRETTTVPTQALYFLNDSFFHRQAETFSEHLMQESSQATRIQLVFSRLLQRHPNDDEMAISAQLLDQYPGTEADKWAALARIILASNEFLYVD